MHSKTLCSCLLASVLLSGSSNVVAASPEPSADSLQERGRYLVTMGGCDDCHSPKVFTENGPEPDPGRRLSGHPADEQLPALPAGIIGPEQWGAVTNNGLTAWVGPWGVSFAANLTPDATGLGSWTGDNFIQAMRTGKHLGVGRPILPPMPWPALREMTDEDLRAVFAYLQSLAPVPNQVPAPLPPEPAPVAAK